MEQQELIPHLFRIEYRKIVSVLCRRFGFDQIEVAEDIASDTFLTAAQTWGMKGVPPNPIAWLYSVAKNKAKNYLQRQHIFENKITPELKTNSSDVDENEIDLSLQNINDSQLLMMFAICHPSISPEAQVGLSLRILCGLALKKLQTLSLQIKRPLIKDYSEQKKNSGKKKLKLSSRVHQKLMKD